MDNAVDPDRRLSFRINDQALLELAVLPNASAKEPLDSYFNPSTKFQLLADLQQLDNELQHQLFKLTETNTLLATALQLLNRKIERLALQAGTEDSAQALQPLTLSEGGISFQSQQRLNVACLCAVRIRLLPEGYALQSYARVVYCLDQNEAKYRIGLQFIELDETGRDLIARHLLELQAHNRRIQRQQLDDHNPR